MCRPKMVQGEERIVQVRIARSVSEEIKAAMNQNMGPAPQTPKAGKSQLGVSLVILEANRGRWLGVNGADKHESSVRRSRREA